MWSILNRPWILYVLLNKQLTWSFCKINSRTGSDSSKTHLKKLWSGKLAFLGVPSLITTQYYSTQTFWIQRKFSDSIILFWYLNGYICFGIWMATAGSEHIINRAPCIAMISSLRSPNTDVNPSSHVYNMGLGSWLIEETSDPNWTQLILLKCVWSQRNQKPARLSHLSHPEGSLAQDT